MKMPRGRGLVVVLAWHLLDLGLIPSIEKGENELRLISVSVWLVRPDQVSPRFL